MQRVGKREQHVRVVRQAKLFHESPPRERVFFRMLILPEPRRVDETDELGIFWCLFLVRKRLNKLPFYKAVGAAERRRRAEVAHPLRVSSSRLQLVVQTRRST
jgi:hypothetical protein